MAGELSTLRALEQERRLADIHQCPVCHFFCSVCDANQSCCLDTRDARIIGAPEEEAGAVDPVTIPTRQGEDGEEEVDM